MPIVCVGINFRSAPVAVRERLAFSGDEQRDLLLSDELRRAGDPVGLREFALLSTCNRTELYAAAPDVTRRFRRAPTELTQAIASMRGLSPVLFAPHVYTHTSSGAVRHLCRVASGLDSMVLGESEILGQVASAHALARGQGTAGRVLEAVFHTALRAGRRARTETGICRCPMSVSSEAIRMLRETGWQPARSTVLIVGTGRMGRLAGEALRSHGARALRVVSRTTAHAQSLARMVGAQPLAWHDLAAAIAAADVVVTSTGAPHAVITHELVSRALSNGRSGKPLVLIDIAVPRDVEPEVRTLSGVTVFDLDDLQQRLNGNAAERQREVPAVETIVDDELHHFEEWRRGSELRPVLAAMHAHGNEIRERELARMMRRLRDCSPEMRAQLEAFSRSLTNKLLHEPTRRLRQETDPDRYGEYVRVTRDLFGLDDTRRNEGLATDGWDLAESERRESAA